jgi:hypothetical protein
MQGLGSLYDNPSLRVIPRSPPLLLADDEESRPENTQSEIPLRRLTDRNDSLGRVISQTLGGNRIQRAASSKRETGR